MVKYICDNCKATFDRKCTYTKHLQRKIKCVTGLYKPKDNNIICEHCDKKFSRRDYLKKHADKCPMVMITKNTNNNYNKRVVNNIICNDGTINNGDTNITNITNNNNLLFRICPYDKDGIDCLSPKDKIEILMSIREAIIRIIEKVNFDPNKPEHHNMLLKDLKSGYIEAFINNKWTTTKLSGFIYSLTQVKKKDIEQILEEMKKYITDDCAQTIKNSIENIKIEDAKIMKLLKSYIKAVMYENKDMVEKSKRRYENQFKTCDEVVDRENIANKEFKFINGITMDHFNKMCEEIVLLKNEIEYLLSLPVISTYITNDDILLIKDRARITNDKYQLKTIIICISQALNGKKINNEYVEQKIKNDNQINAWFQSTTRNK